MKCEYNKFYLLDAIDCQWSSWSKIEDCSKSCGGGSQTFRRRQQVKSANGGKDCVGDDIKVEDCNTQPCSGMYPQFKSENQKFLTEEEICYCINRIIRVDSS